MQVHDWPRKRTEKHGIVPDNFCVFRGFRGYISRCGLSKRFPLDVGWMRHAVCAVIHRMCRKAHNKKDVVLLRNARWVTQNALTHPTLRRK